jgi:type IV pilus assembly protein PilW
MNTHGTAGFSKARYGISGLAMNIKPQQKGLSLIELLVSLGLGVFLIMGVVQVFLSNKESTQIETSLSRIQENGRFAIDLLTEDIRKSMHLGCNSGAANLTTMAKDTIYTGLQGFERTSGGWSPALPTALNTAIGTSALVGSDVLNLQHAEFWGINPSASITAASTSLSIAADPTRANCPQQNDRVLVADCEAAHLFTVTNAQPSSCGSATTLAFAASGNDVTSISKGYATTADVMPFFDKLWYVRDTGRDQNGVSVLALYRRNNGVEQEMIEGIENMQILYGEQMNSGNLRYVPASTATLNMNRVVSVRLGLLVQSYEAVLDADDTAAYQVLDESIDTVGVTSIFHNTDRTLRRVFRTTVKLRNRPTSS